MHNILINADIDYKVDPLNLMIVSHGHHKGLHTNAYLIALHAALKAAAGDDDEVRMVLLYARIAIAATDPYPLGY